MKRSTFLRLLGAGLAGSRLDALPASAPARAPAERVFGAWTGDYRTIEEWKRALSRMRAAGINAILPSVGNDRLREVIPVAREEGIAVHAWRKIMMNGSMRSAHPEWYAVSRNGVSTAQKPPYVDYYHFLCPTREPVRDWLAAQADEVARIDGLASVHLDYIRLPDVILPVALWPKYNLVQDREYPDFDFCYCEICRSTFEVRSGIDPLRIPDPPAHESWVRFRWDAITSVVARLHDVVHAHGRQVTAAVFPTPAIARRLVRQDWLNWKIDGLMPMVYNGFYNEPVAWVGSATREGVSALDGRVPLHTGIYVPDLTADQLEQAARLALAAGSNGVVVFDAGAMTDAHWDRFARVARG